MAKYRYAGPGPVQDPDDGTIVRPGDVRELESCSWGPWELIDDGAETPAEPPAGPPAASPASGSGGQGAAQSAPAEEV